jgi:hypothetical protein
VCVFVRVFVCVCMCVFDARIFTMTVYFNSFYANFE